MRIKNILPAAIFLLAILMIGAASASDDADTLAVDNGTGETLDASMEDVDVLSYDEYEDYDLEEDYFEIECPSCGETICYDGSINPEELACPACGEKFECLVSEEDLEALDGDEE